MRKPGIGRGAVPMFNVQRNAHNIALMQNPNRFSAFLIPSLAVQDQQNLSAAVFMPVGAGAGFKALKAAGFTFVRLDAAFPATAAQN